MRLIKVSALILSSLLSSQGSSAQVGSSSAWATASATIVKAAAIEEESPTAESKVLELTGIKLFPSKARSVRSSNPFSLTAAAFRVTDEEHFAFSILFPRLVSFNRCTPTTDDTLILQNFSCIPSNGIGATGGTRIFKLNADLHLPAVQQPGAYLQESSFEVNIIYN